MSSRDCSLLTKFEKEKHFSIGECCDSPAQADYRVGHLESREDIIKAVKDILGSKNTPKKSKCLKRRSHLFKRSKTLEVKLYKISCMVDNS